MRKLILLVVGLTLFASVAAQDVTPEPTSEPVDCTIDGLKAYYTGLTDGAQAALDAAGPDSDLPQEALGALYDAASHTGTDVAAVTSLLISTPCRSARARRSSVSSKSLTH